MVVLCKRLLGFGSRVDVETDILCQLREWVSELRVCAGLTRRLVKFVVPTRGIISVAASRTGDPSHQHPWKTLMSGCHAEWGVLSIASHLPGD